MCIILMSTDSVRDVLYPSEVHMHVGGSVILNCRLESPVQWTFKNSSLLPINSENLTDTTKLLIKNVSPINNGEYRCYGMSNFEYFVGQSNLQDYGRSS